MTLTLERCTWLFHTPTTTPSVLCDLQESDMGSPGLSIGLSGKLDMVSATFRGPLIP
ncbi:hypothetical protein DPMN_034682 [Dreissena polymorpha]|uniref:Uncharacterized protein n=1 Tax=Dreissena polymorpha TaxID=45954 RepID=A0A9D4M941_DREPO|nr:hypothetical protein DPMN_034682 [Dreissena polymorpha]